MGKAWTPIWKDGVRRSKITYLVHRLIVVHLSLKEGKRCALKACCPCTDQLVSAKAKMNCYFIWKSHFQIRCWTVCFKHWYMKSKSFAGLVLLWCKLNPPLLPYSSGKVEGALSAAVHTELFTSLSILLTCRTCHLPVQCLPNRFRCCGITLYSLHKNHDRERERYGLVWRYVQIYADTQLMLLVHLSTLMYFDVFDWWDDCHQFSSSPASSQYRSSSRNLIRMEMAGHLPEPESRVSLIVSTVEQIDWTYVVSTTYPQKWKHI